MDDEFFACQCDLDEHTIRFSVDAEYGELYVSVFLGHAGCGFFGRLWTGLKYAFGYKSKYGHFDNTMIKMEDRERLIEAVRKSMEVTAAKKAPQ